MDKIAFFEKITIYFSFLNINSLFYFEDLSSLNTIDLSGYQISDIKLLCGEVPFINLKVLKICKNSGIINLNKLKNAKFTNLNALYLIEDELEDLSQIEMDKYPFENLEVLNLINNKIVKIEPILHFTKLQYLNLRKNKVFNDDALILLEKMKCNMDLRGNYTYVEEIKNKIGEISVYIKL